MTKGTIISIVVSCLLAVIGVLQGVDWVHVIGSQSGGWVVAVLMGLSALLHAVTGSDGLLSTKTASSPPR